MARDHKLIEPFTSTQVREGVISYGISSYGYDLTVSDEYKIFTPGLGMQTIIDPKDLDTRLMVDFKGPVCVIPSNSFVLARTVEYIHIPRDVTGLCVGKSTYARCGVLLNTTPLEAGWHGFVTLEISNTAPVPVKIYSFEGIAQVLFFKADSECDTSYADRGGKYQGQKGIALPRI